MISQLYFFPKIENSIISSSMVKEIIKNGGDLNMFLPPEVVKLIHQISKT